MANEGKSRVIIQGSNPLGGFEDVQTDGSGALQVAGGGAGGGTQYSEDTASTAAEQVTMAGVVRKDGGGSLVDLDGDRTELQVDANGALRVTGGGGGTEYTEDAVAAANPVGSQIMSRRRDTLTAAEVTTDGDVIALNSTAKGELYVKQTDAVPVTDNGGTLSVDDGAGSLTVDGTVGVSGTVAVAGDVAAGSADSGNPVKIGGKYNTIAPAITSGQRGDIQLDNKGQQRVALFKSGSDQQVDADATSDGLPSTKVGVWSDAMNLVWNGTGWDRLKGDATNGAFVNVKAMPNPSQYHGKTIVDVAMDAQASGDLVAAQGVGNKIKVVSFFGTISLDGTMKFTRGTGPTNITGAMTLKAGGGFVALTGSPEAPIFETGANEKLSIVMTGGTFSGLLRYYVET